MSVLTILLILLVGTVAGFLNTVAGGGSLIAMPFLIIFLGLPSAVANGTNRVALMVQNLVAITNFRSKGYFDWRFSLKLGIPALIGSIIGSKIAVELNDAIFNKILAGVMIIVLILILWNPQKKLAAAGENLSSGRQVVAMIVFFFVGLYGGFIQAGVGFIIIVALTLITGLSLVKINSLKVFVIALYMSSSLVVFILSGKVNWVLGLTLAVGNGIGAWLGSNFAVAKGDRWIRTVLVITVLAMAAKLLGLFG